MIDSSLILRNDVYLKPEELYVQFNKSLGAAESLYNSLPSLFIFIVFGLLLFFIALTVFLLKTRRKRIRKALELFTSMRAGIDVKLPRDYTKKIIFALQQAESNGKPGRLIYMLSPGLYASLLSAIHIDTVAGRSIVFSDTRILHVHPLMEEEADKRLYTTIAIDYSRKYRTDYAEAEESTYSFESARSIWNIARKSNTAFITPFKEPVCPYCKTPLPEEPDSSICSYCEKNLVTGDASAILYNTQSPLIAAIRYRLDKKFKKSVTDDIETEDLITAGIARAVFPEADIPAEGCTVTQEALNKLKNYIRAGNLFPLNFNINYVKLIPIKDEQDTISALAGISLTRAFLHDELMDTVDPVPIIRNYILEGKKNSNKITIEDIIPLGQAVQRPVYKRLRKTMDNLLTAEETAALIISAILIAQQNTIPDITEAMESLIQKTKTTTLIRHSLPHIARGKQGIILPESRGHRNRLKNQLERLTGHLKNITIENTYLDYFKEILTD